MKRRESSTSWRPSSPTARRSWKRPTGEFLKASTKVTSEIAFSPINPPNSGLASFAKWCYGMLSCLASEQLYPFKENPSVTVR